LWTVWEITRKPGGEKERYIGLDLLGTDGEGNWGYKDLEESMGVYEVNCPLSFLALVPQVANEGWRERVRAHHARINQKVVVGQTLKLVNASIPHVLVTSVRPLRGTYLGGTYRIPRRFLAPPEEQETAHKPKPAPAAPDDYRPRSSRRRGEIVTAATEAEALEAEQRRPAVVHPSSVARRGMETLPNEHLNS